MTRIIVLVAFAAALALQALWWGTQGIYDADIWGAQSRHMLAGSPEQFNAAAAYGHPGGPIILVTAIADRIIDAEASTVLLVALALLMSIVIAGVALLAYWLSGTLWLPALLTILLSVHPLYVGATPPSALAGVLAVSLVLLTVLVHRQPSVRSVLLWGVLAGVLCATRADIGGAYTLVLGLVLLPVMGMRRMGMAALAAIATFIVLDPFMWFMPLQHLYDVMFKAYFHYAVIALHALPLEAVLLFSVGTLVSAALGAACLARRTLPIPPALYLALLALTAVLASVFLTAEYQATRYFLPLVLVWEALLPFFVLALARTRAYALVLGLVLLSYPVAHLIARLV